MDTSYLQPDEIVRTLDRLTRRIIERFPSSALGRVCESLAGGARQAQARSQWIARPFWPLRLASLLLVTALVVGSANDLEAMVTGLARKIGQKIMILHSLEHWQEGATP